jgi:hypothetical protein
MGAVMSIDVRTTQTEQMTAYQRTDPTDVAALVEEHPAPRRVNGVREAQGQR